MRALKLLNFFLLFICSWQVNAQQNYFDCALNERLCIALDDKMPQWRSVVASPGFGDWVESTYFLDKPGYEGVFVYASLSELINTNIANSAAGNLMRIIATYQLDSSHDSGSLSLMCSLAESCRKSYDSNLQQRVECSKPKVKKRYLSIYPELSSLVEHAVKYCPSGKDCKLYSSASVLEGRIGWMIASGGFESSYVSIDRLTGEFVEERGKYEIPGDLGSLITERVVGSCELGRLPARKF